MASQVDVYNRALSKLGEDYKVTDPAGDPVKAVRALNAAWDMTRRRVLRDNPWNFATQRVRLAQLAGVDPDTIYPYAAAFRLSADIVRFLDILDVIADDDWALENGVILARGYTSLRVRCVVDVTAIELWDDLAIDALASALAFEIADELTGDASRKAAARGDQREAIAMAKGMDAIENPPIAPEEDEWIVARWRW